MIFDGDERLTINWFFNNDDANLRISANSQTEWKLELASRCNLFSYLKNENDLTINNSKTNFINFTTNQEN